MDLLEALAAIECSAQSKPRGGREMDLLTRILRRKGFARNQKATVFQSLRGINLSISTYAVLNCAPFSIYIGYTILSPPII
jgi:hypothetical protein